MQKAYKTVEGRREYARQYYVRNRKTSRNWYLENREKVLAARKAHYATHKDEVRAYQDENKDRLIEYRKEYRARIGVRLSELLRNAKNRATKKGIPFDLDEHIPELESRLAVGGCELSGVPFVWKGKRSSRSPSFDRVIPSLGYVYSNVRIICFCLNAAFGTWGESEAVEIFETWKKSK